MMTFLYDAWYSFSQAPGWWLTDECLFLSRAVVDYAVAGFVAGLTVGFVAGWQALLRTGGGKG